MAAKCFSRTIKGYRDIVNNINKLSPIHISDEQISKVIYMYAALARFEDAADVFNEENIEDLKEYVENKFLVNRYLDFHDEELNKKYEDWFINNADERGVVIGRFTQEEINDIIDITNGSAVVFEPSKNDRNPTTTIIVPSPKNFQENISKDDIDSNTEKEIDDINTALEILPKNKDADVESATNFVFNYIKNLFVSPRYKGNFVSDKESAIDYYKSGDSTIDKKIIDKANGRLKSEIYRIFGFIPPFLNDIENSNSLEVALNNYLNSGKWIKDCLKNIRSFENILRGKYNELSQLKLQKEAAQRYLKNQELSTDEDRSVINNILSNKLSNSKLTDNQYIGYNLKKINKQIAQLEDSIKNLNYASHAKKISLRNRIFASRAISNFNKLVKDKILLEYKSFITKEGDYSKFDKDIEKYIKFDELLGAASDKSVNKHNLFFEKTGTYRLYDIADKISKDYPEFASLINILKEANKNIVVFVDDEEVFGEGGRYEPINNRIVYHRNNSDIHVVVHEMIHAATSYILASKDKETDTQEFYNKVSEFIDYLKSYIGNVSEKLNSYTTQKDIFKAYGIPTDVYGFESPSEFIAEVFSNIKFQELLDNIPAMDEKKFNSLFEEFLDIIINFLNNIFGIHSERTALDQAREIGLMLMRTQAENIDNIVNELREIRKLKKSREASEGIGFASQRIVVNNDDYTNHSGGAIGSDSYWGEIGEKYGVKSNHYYHGKKTPNGNIEITEDEFEEGKQRVLKANKTLNRRTDSYMDLLARNWMQVKNSDAVFAIGSIKNNIVDGDTGWAVQMAIDTRKPIYVFDQDKEQWYKYSNGKFVKTDTPTLTKNFAGIGSRKLTDVGKKAIEDVYQKTFGQEGKQKNELKQYEESQKINKVESTFEQQVKRIKDGLIQLGKSIQFDPKTHTYKILDSNGKPIKADTSVTSIKDFLEGKTKQSKPSAATVIGTSFDSIVRDFFDKGRLVRKYPNISQNQKKALRQQLVNLKSFFDKQFKEGYEVITQEDMLRVGGFIAKGDKTISVGGTMDMIVLAKNDNDVDVYIYDVKTRKGNLDNGTLVKYTDQVNFYKKLLSANMPELADKIKGMGLIVAETKYGKNGNNEFSDYSIGEDGETILYDDNAIEDTENEITVNLRSEIYKNEGKIISLDESKYIEDSQFDFEGLEEDEKEALTGLGETDDAVQEFLGNSRRNSKDGEESVDFAEDERYKNISECTPMVDGACPITEREQVFLGRAIVKYISFIADQLASNPETKIVIFGSEKSGGSSYADDFFIGKRDTLMTQDVFNAIKEYLVTTSPFFDITSADNDVMAEKLIWASEHADALINAAYADLLDLERISISTTGDIQTESMTEDALEAYERAEEAVEERAAYSIDSREVSYLGSMSTQFKRSFSKIFNYKYDENGNIVTNENGIQYEEDEWGYHIPTFIPRATVVNKLYELCYGKGDVRQMLRAIQEGIQSTPWLSQVFDIINNDKVLKKQLFTVFRKDRNNYTKSYKRKGAQIPTRLNVSNTVSNILTKTQNLLNSENRPLLFIHKDGDANGVFSIDSDVFEDIENELKNISKLSGRKKARTIARILEDLGIEVDDISAITSKSARNILASVLENLHTGTYSVYKTLRKINESGGRFTFQKDLSNAYYKLVQSIAPILDEKYELSARDNSKNYQTFSDPTAMGTIVDRLAGRSTIPYLDNDEVPTDEELYKMLFEQKYDKYWQFGYEMTDEFGLPKRIYFNKWLNKLKNDPDSRKFFIHTINTSANEKGYLKQTQFEYAISILLRYAAPSMKIGGKENFYTGKKDLAMYRIPTMSDKPADECIQFTKYAADLNNEDEGFGLDKMKQDIAEDAFDYLRFEIRRMKELVSHLRNDDGSGDIEFFTLPFVQEFEDVRKGGDVQMKHFVRDGKMLADKSGQISGFKFEYLPMLNDELIKGTEYGQLIIDAINGGVDELEALRDGFFDVFSTAMDKEFAAIKYMLRANGGDSILKNSIDDINSDEQVDAFLEEFVWNDALAAMNIFNLTVIDPAFHKNSSDLQKRFAEFHASTQRPNVLAEFTDASGNTRRVSDGKMRFVVLEDIYEDSDIATQVSAVFAEAAKTAPNKARAAELKAMAALAKNKWFKDIILTDGQSFGSPTGFWKKLTMLGEENPELDKAIQMIRNGDFTLRGINTVIQAFKSFVFSQREQHVGESDILVPTQIKHSEAMIVLAGAIMKGSGGNGILSALYDIMEESHNINGEYQNDGIDNFVFHSAVKTGATKIIDLTGVKPEKIKDTILDLIYSNGNYTDFIQEIPFEDWGKQQEVPAHFEDNEQGMPSQGRVLSVSDLSNTNDYHIKGKKEAVSKKEFLDRYFSLHQQVFEIGIKRAQKALGLNGNKLERNKKLSEILINNIAKDSKYSIELRKAFTLVNGEFVMPLGDPSFGDKVYGTVVSLLKKYINDELFPGGPTVIRSSVGLSDDLHFFKDDDGGWTAEIYASFPSSEIEDAMTYSYSRHNKIKGLKGYNEGDIISVEDGLKFNLITKDNIIGIADRIPTENKYSQIRYRIKEFLPKFSGEYFIFPKEKTMLGGDDFDIDKVYPRRKYKLNANYLRKLADEGKISADEVDDIMEELEAKNEIFDIQWQALGHKSAQTQMLKPGSFQRIKDIAKEINPDFGHENHPLVYFMSQLFYQKANAAGKQFVGISALNNTAHAFCEIANTGFVEMLDFTIDGKSSEVMYNKESDEYKFDMMYSPFDGSLISDTVCMFVGASADNAKDAVLGAVNANPITATSLIGLLRIGIPLRTALYMMNLPSIKSLVDAAESNGKTFENILLSQDTDIYKSEKNKIAISGSDPIYSSYDIRTDKLLERIRKGGDDFTDIDIVVYNLLKDFIPYFNAIRLVTDRTAVNSTKNAAHKNAFDAMQRKLKAEEFENGKSEELDLLGESARNINNEIPMLGTLSKVNTEIIPKVFESFSPVFSEEFKNDDGTGILDVFMANGYTAQMLNEKILRKILNAWLVYKATRTMIDARPEARQKRMYDFPIQFIKASGKLAGNMFIQNIASGDISYDYRFIGLTLDSTKMTREAKDDVAAAYAELSDNESARPILDDYLDYMISRFGFGFAPKSSMQITPNKEKLRYKENDGNSPYVELFSTKFSDRQIAFHIPNFAIQFARQNPYSAFWLQKSRNDVEFSDDGNILVDDDTHEQVKDSSRFGIAIGDSIYVDSEKRDRKSKRHIYKRVYMLGIPNQFLEYNAGENGWDMNTVITRKNNEKQGSIYSNMFEQQIEDNENIGEETEDDGIEVGNEDEGEYAKIQWFEKLRSQKTFKKMIEEVGFDDDFFNRGTESELFKAIKRLYKAVDNLESDMSKYNKIMEQIKEKVC